MCIFIPIILALSGCVNFEDAIWQQSGIENNQDYTLYKEAEIAGQLDETGYYEKAEAGWTALAKDHSGEVHVTFANNAFLKIGYFKDEACTESIEGSRCYLKPGEGIYASNAIVSNSRSDLYSFAEIRVWEYDASGERTLLASINKLPSLLFDAKENSSREISIEPVGKYKNRELQFDAFYYNTKGKSQPLDFEWTVNSKKTSEISPVESYTVVCHYENYLKDFYFVDSTPTCYCDKDKDGEVIFWEASSNKPCEEYIAQFRRFITLNIKNDSYPFLQKIVRQTLRSDEAGYVVKYIKKNGETETFQENDQFAISKVKCGDTITICVDADYKIVSQGLDVGTAAYISDGQEYTIKIPETNEYAFDLTICKRNSDIEGVFEAPTIENGTVQLVGQNGMEVRGGDELPADDEIVTVRITPAAGYYITGKKVKNDVYEEKMKYSDACQNFGAITKSHPILPFISITLNSTDSFGDCKFTFGGKDVNNTTVAARIGDEIKLEYTLFPDSGYRIIREGFLPTLLSKVHSDNSVSVTFEVTDSVKREISRSDLIQIKREG